MIAMHPRAGAIPQPHVEPVPLPADNVDTLSLRGGASDACIGGGVGTEAETLSRDLLSSRRGAAYQDFSGGTGEKGFWGAP